MPHALPAPVRSSTPQQFHFGDFTLDQSSYRLQKGDRVLRLEKLPMELLILLLQRHGELISREEIAANLWDKDVFVDVDHSINTAIRKIRLVLRDDPEKPRFVETVIGKGYRFVAPVTGNGNSISNASVADASPVPQPASAPPIPSPTIPKQSTSARITVLLAGLLVLALLIISFVLYRTRKFRRPIQPTAIKSIAVLPLKNLSGDPTQDYLADGITEALIGRLSRIHDLRVISRTSVVRFKDPQLSAPEIANSLHVDALVEGSVIRDGTRIRVNAQLIRAATDEHFWSEAYDRELRDVLSLESEVAQAIAAKVEVTITGKEHERLAAVRPVPPEVYENYLKGWYSLQKSNSRVDVEKSVAYFQKAIDQDPAFALAYVGLAGSYDELNTIFMGAPPAEVRNNELAAARKALELDPDIAEAHVIVASLDQTQWQWAEAESEYRRALDLNPNDPAAYGGFSFWLLCQGRLDEALEWARRARELDPLGVSSVGESWVLFMARRYNEAIRELRNEVALNPDRADAHWNLGFALIGNQQFEEAIPVLQKSLSLTRGSPAVTGVLIHAYAHAGHRSVALRLLEELKRRQKSGYVPAGAFVNAYVGLDDREQAFVWLERAYQEHSNILLFLKVHPYFDPIRNDPRYTDLLHRVGLDKSY